MGFGLSTIGQIAITVSRVDAAIVFYRDKLGMKLLFQIPNRGFFDCGGVRLMLTGSAETACAVHSSILYFKVHDIQQAQQELAGRGVPFEGEPAMIARMPDHDLWMAFFRDLDGNVLALMSEVPHDVVPVAG